MKNITIIALALIILAGCTTTPPDIGESVTFSEWTKINFFCLTFSKALAEFTVAHDEVLPNDMQSLVDWYNRKTSDIQWSAKNLSNNCEISWGKSVKRITWKSSWKKPPAIIKFKTDYLKNRELSANRHFIESLIEYRSRSQQTTLRKAQ